MAMLRIPSMLLLVSVFSYLYCSCYFSSIKIRVSLWDIGVDGEQEEEVVELGTWYVGQ